MSRPPITEEKYNDIKTLCGQTRMTNVEIARICKVSDNTVSRVRRAYSIADYRKMSKRPKPEEVNPDTDKADKPQQFIASFAQVKALAKDVDGIKQMLALILSVLQKYMEV